MKTPPPIATAISGDLPIRSAIPLKQEESLKKEEASEEATTIKSSESPKPVSTAPVQVIETAKKVSMDPQIQNLETELAEAVGTNVGRKKRKHRRPKSKRGQGKPTGFEEYYCEGPITPKEYEEMRKLYDP